MANLILDITQTEEVNRENFQRIYEDNFKQIKENLNSSKGKDIVAFVGLTGSGKSTLINYLCRKELLVDEDDNIVLKNPNDSNAMQIGITSVSETFLPKFIDCNKFLLYDLPGFGDSRGTLVNLFNSAIVKNIVENAKSVIIVVVISEDELIAGRGRLFKELVLRLNFFFPNETLEGNSVLVVTKSSPRKNIDYLVRKIRQKTGGDVVIKWSSNGCFAKMERACERKINEVDRNQIFNAICNVQKKHISHIDTCAIYDERSLSVLRKICKEEMQNIFEHHLLKIFDPTLIDSLSIQELRSKINQIKKSIDECQFDCSTLIILLKTISMDVFNYALVKQKDKMRQQLQRIILQIEMEIKKRNEMFNSEPQINSLLITVAGIGVTFLFKKLFGF